MFCFVYLFILALIYYYCSDCVVLYLPGVAVVFVVFVLFLFLLLLFDLFFFCMYRYMQLEAKLANARGVTLDSAVYSADNQQHGAFGNLNMSASARRIGDQTRAAAMASAGGLRR